MDLVCDGGYEVVGSGGACGAGLMDVKSSHHSSNSILDEKIWMLSKNNDDLFYSKASTYNFY